MNDYDESYHYKLGILERKMQSGTGSMMFFMILMIGFGLLGIFGNLDNVGKTIIVATEVAFLTQVIRYYRESRKVFNLYEKGVVFGMKHKLRAIAYDDIVEVHTISKKEGTTWAKMTFYYCVVTLNNGEEIMIPWPSFHTVLAEKRPELILS